MYTKHHSIFWSCVQIIATLDSTRKRNKLLVDRFAEAIQNSFNSQIYKINDKLFIANLWKSLQDIRTTNPTEILIYYLSTKINWNYTKKYSQKYLHISSRFNHLILESNILSTWTKKLIGFIVKTFFPRKRLLNLLSINQ